MVEISEMLKRIQGSERALSRGIPVPPGAIRLQIGEPDFSTPVHIQEAAFRAMKDGYTHYEKSPLGTEELREAICLSLKRDYGVERNPENVLITAGGAEAINIIVATYLNPGEEVLVFDPGYSAYGESVSLFGGRPVFISLQDDYHIDLDAVRKPSQGSYEPFNRSSREKRRSGGL